MATESIKKKRVLGGQDDNEQQDEESPAKKLKTLVSCRIYPQLCSTCAPTALDRNLLNNTLRKKRVSSVVNFLMELEQRMQDKQESLQQEAKGGET
jgi:hypothetical protein